MHQKLVEWPLVAPEVEPFYKTGPMHKIYVRVYILTYIDKINNLLIYVEKLNKIFISTLLLTSMSSLMSG